MHHDRADTGLNFLAILFAHQKDRRGERRALFGILQSIVKRTSGEVATQ
jgi:hypothetical protein